MGNAWCTHYAPLGKDFMRELFAPTTRVPCSWSYGGYAKRRREGASMQQCALRARLRAARVSHLGRSHDIRNAFASPHQLGTIGDSSKHLSPQAEPFVRQRVLEATTSMTTPSGCCTVLHGAGALQGDSVAGELFSATYEPQVASWLERTSDPPSCRRVPVLWENGRHIADRIRRRPLSHPYSRQLSSVSHRSDGWQ